MVILPKLKTQNHWLDQVPRNGLSENNADGNGLQDGNKSDIVDNKQNGFTNETKASQEGDDKKEKNGIEEDKGRYKVEFHLL